MNKKLIGYYDYTVILTYMGMLSAFFGILSAIDENFKLSIFFLMLAGICDMFDGAVASTKERDTDQKNFGIQIDSLSDLISFGVLPGVFVFMISDRHFWVGVISGLFTLSALIRLAYYNILEANRQKETTESRKVFLGVPVTTIAMLLPLAFIAYQFPFVPSYLHFPIVLLVTAIGFLLPVNVPKPQKVGKIVMVAIGLLELAGLFVFC